MDTCHCHAVRHPGTGLGRGLAAAVFTLACLSLGSARAQPSGLGHAAAGTVVAQVPQPSVTDQDSPFAATRAGLAWRWEALPGARSQGVPLDAAHAGRGAASAIDYRLWFGDQRTEVGLGFAPRQFGRTEASAPMDFALREAPGVVLAFRHQVSAQSQLTFDTRWSASGDAQTNPTRKTAFELGLESSPLHGLAKGTLLRAQLNAHSNLALRLRGGRLGLYLGVRIAGAE